VLNTGGWQNWKPIAISNVALKAGKQILRIEIDTDTPSEKKNWLFSLNSIDIKKSTSVGIVERKTVPTSFSLKQNYPNPFNPSTIIEYELPVSGNVALKIFNVLGAEVAVLINEEKSAGSYEYEFSSENFNLTSGIYFYQLTAGNFAQTKKMVLLR